MLRSPEPVLGDFYDRAQDGVDPRNGRFIASTITTPTYLTTVELLGVIGPVEQVRISFQILASFLYQQM